VLVGVTIQKITITDNPSNKIDYTPVFYLNLSLNLAGAVVAFFHHSDENVKSSQVLKGKYGIR